MRHFHHFVKYSMKAVVFFIFGILHNACSHLLLPLRTSGNIVDLL